MSRLPDFTICVLLYGDYPDLAKRCLNDGLLSMPPDEVEIRVGMNECSKATTLYVEALVDKGLLQRDNIYFTERNLHKYPMMRQMFHGPRPLTTAHTVWFDDDSFLQPSTSPMQWREGLRLAMLANDMVGAIYTIQLTGEQHRWIKDQPWYNGKSVNAHHKVAFCTGGFWCIRTRILQDFNWPTPELDHRGGDVMLGELCRQQGFRLGNFRAGVAINADEAGCESKARRRGYDSQPIGYSYSPASRVIAAAPPIQSIPTSPATAVKPRKLRLNLDL